MWRVKGKAHRGISGLPNGGSDSPWITKVIHTAYGSIGSIGVPTVANVMLGPGTTVHAAPMTVELVDIGSEASVTVAQ
jgi:hypothetical protein